MAVMALVCALLLVTLSSCEYITAYLLKDVELPEVSASPSPTPTPTPTPVPTPDPNAIGRTYGIDLLQRTDIMPASGGTLRIAALFPDTLNPLITEYDYNQRMLSLVFDPLFRVDKTLQPAGVIAEDWRFSVDGRTLTVTIRPDLTWHDDTPVTAADVVASLEQARYSPNANYANALSNVESIAHQDHAVILKLFAPQSGIVSLLGIPIVKADAAGVSEGFTPIGTGPYRVKEIRRDVIQLERSTSDRHGRLRPYIDAIHVALLPNTDAMHFLYESRIVSFTYTDMFDIATYAASTKNRITPYDTNGFVFIGLNFDHPALSQLTVRRAFAQAIDRDTLCNEVLLGDAYAVDGFLSSEWWMFEPTARRYDYDTTIAKGLLNNAGYESLELNMAVSYGNRTHELLAQRIAGYLARIGVTVHIIPIDSSMMEYAVSTGAYDLYLGLLNVSPDADVMALLRHTATTAQSRAGLLSDMEMVFQPMWDQLSRQTSDEARARIYNRINSAIVEQLPCIPLYYEIGYMLHDESLFPRVTSPYGVFADIPLWHIYNAPTDAPTDPAAEPDTDPETE